MISSEILKIPALSQISTAVFRIKDFSDIENERRYWEIKGFSKVPCGGTHVKSTAEVGYITLKRVNIGGGKERIEIKLTKSF